MSEETLLYIKKGHNRVVRSKENLLLTSDLEVGQVFNSVARHYKKEKSDYLRWISYEKNRAEFDIIKERIDSCDNDFDKVNLVCEWLGEETLWP